MKRTIIIDIISALILLLLLYTSVSKLAEHQKFRDVLLSSPLLKPVAGFVSGCLPILEFVIAILLFIPATRVKGLFASLILLIVLTGYLIYMILFSPHLPCGCGGVVENLTWHQHIVFNLFFIILSVIGILFARSLKRGLSSAPT